MKKFLVVLAGIVLVGLTLPSATIIPVEKASCHDWNSKTFWFEPWGVSGVHKGIDIFAKKGTPVIAANSGVIVYRGSLPRGGNVVLMLGPKWRFYYYSHLDSFDDSAGLIVTQGATLGTVGSTGNAIGKAAHLHYSVVTAIPYPWRWSNETQGWKKMFYLDPADTFSQCHR